MTGQPSFFCNEQLKELSAAGGSEGREAIGVQASLRTTDFAPFAVRHLDPHDVLAAILKADVSWLAIALVLYAGNIAHG
jgi:hypothetical protein